MATKAIVGEKVGMTQVWDDQNRVVPVTVLKVTPCRVVQVKRPDTDGYSALQVTYGSVRTKSLNKPELGHFGKNGVEPGKKLVELRLDDWVGCGASVPRQRAPRRGARLGGCVCRLGRGRRRSRDPR